MMELVLESAEPSDYLACTEIVDFRSSAVAQAVQEIREASSEPLEQARMAFELARDGVRHSFDIEGTRVTIAASEAFAVGEGICFAKAHLLAALYRGLGIPTGFCYQRVMRRGTPASGYALHGLNAAFFPVVGWVRLDPRGEKPGVHSEFSLGEERLAYHLDAGKGEVDYPYVFVEPLEPVVEAMRSSGNCDDLFARRPAEITPEDLARHGLGS